MTEFEIQVHGGITVGDIKEIEICDVNIIQKYGTIDAFMKNTSNKFISQSDFTFSQLRDTLRNVMDKGVKVTMGTVGAVEQWKTDYARLVKTSVDKASTMWADALLVKWRAKGGGG